MLSQDGTFFGTANHGISALLTGAEFFFLLLPFNEMLIKTWNKLYHAPKFVCYFKNVPESLVFGFMHP
jgi:hypothetical protein